MYGHCCKSIVFRSKTSQGAKAFPMELYLIRHGIAVERGLYDIDAERPLTDKGRKRTVAVGKRLKALEIHFDLILTSPLVRARQTAEILHSLDLSARMAISQNLAQEGNIEAWVAWLEHWRSALRSPQPPVNAPREPKQIQPTKLALVGHEPNLGEWAEQLLWGRSPNVRDSAERFIVKKAGVLGFHLPDQGSPLGNSQLFWLSPPRLLLP